MILSSRIKKVKRSFHACNLANTKSNTRDEFATYTTYGLDVMSFSYVDDLIIITDDPGGTQSESLTRLSLSPPPFVEEHFF